MPMTSPEPSNGLRSRRMRATRERITDSALELAGEDPQSRLTAERIADRAGVSRRTFFNYFPSVEAAFFAPVQNLLRAAVEHVETIPLDVPLLDAMSQAMAAAAEREPLDRLGLCAHYGARLPQLQGSDLEQWEVAEALLSEAFAQRYPHLHAFDVRCLTGAVIGTCRAAVQEWDARTDGRGGSDSAPLLAELMQTALTRVATGFASVVDRR
jgi:AcrR family transcriptional regulator